MFRLGITIRGNFWQGPFSKDALLENGTKSHNFTNLFFVTSHFGTLLFLHVFFLGLLTKQNSIKLITHYDV